MVVDLREAQREMEIEVTAWSNKIKAFLASICDTCLVFKHNEELAGIRSNQKTYGYERWKDEEGRIGYWKSGYATHRAWVKHVEQAHKHWLEALK